VFELETAKGGAIVAVQDVWVDLDRMVEPLSSIALLVQTRVDAGKVVHTREMVRVASDPLQVVVLGHLNSTLFLHGVALDEPEFSILEGLLPHLGPLTGDDLNHNKLAAFLIFRSKCLIFFVFHHVYDFTPPCP